MKYFVFPTPENAHCTLRHDAGWSLTGTPDTDPAGRPGQSFTIPSATPAANGAELDISADGKVPVNLRGVLIFDTPADRAYLMCDDFRLQDVPAPPPPDPGPTPGPEPAEPRNPQELIEQVAQTGQFDLATHAGCGLFTEECCRQLHEKFAKKWGHIRKNEGQNQFNSHAVDAIMLLSQYTNPDGTVTENGVYDIITSSVSAAAKPAFNYVGSAEPDLWYYPAAPIVPPTKK